MPIAMAFSRRRMFNWLLCVGCLAVVVVAASLIVPSPRGLRGPFWDAYQQVVPGMTSVEVDRILGPATDARVGQGTIPDVTFIYINANKKIEVDYQPPWESTDLIVKGKRFYPETMWNYLWSHY
jgi:hypothetical protein